MKPGSVLVGNSSSAPEVDHEVDRLVVGPDVGAAVDAGLEDRQVGRGSLDSRCRLRPAVVAVGRSRLRRARAPATQCRGRRRPRRRCRGPACAGRALAAASSSALARVVLDRRRRPACAWSGRTRARPAARAARRREASRGGGALGLVGVGDHVAAVEDRHRRRGRPRRSIAAARCGVITAAVSSSTPMPSSCGHWATIISSRP